MILSLFAIKCSSTMAFQCPGGVIMPSAQNLAIRSCSDVRCFAISTTSESAAVNSADPIDGGFVTGNSRVDEKVQASTTLPHNGNTGGLAGFASDCQYCTSAPVA